MCLFAAATRKPIASVARETRRGEGAFRGVMGTNSSSSSSSSSTTTTTTTTTAAAAAAAATYYYYY